MPRWMSRRRRPVSSENAEPRLHRDHQQGLVATADPGAKVGAVEQRVDFARSEEADQGAVALFGRDGQDALDHCGVLGVTQGSEPEQ